MMLPGFSLNGDDSGSPPFEGEKQLLCLLRAAAGVAVCMLGSPGQDSWDVPSGQV